MADEISPGRLGGRRVSRTTAGGVKKTSSRKKSSKASGMKAVDTIPRLEDYPDDDSESATIEKMIGDDWPEDLNGSAFAEDLGKILAYVKGLPLEERGAGSGGDLLEECSRILQEELDKARDVAASRKAMPRA